MNIQEHVNYWLDSANNDLGAAEQLFSSARYDWCLFISEFYKLCTREFAESYFARIKEFVSWLTSQITFDESLDNT